jgi:hypothetical protein
MSIRIDANLMSSDRSDHTASVPDGVLVKLGNGGRVWELSWLPGERFDRDRAISGMLIADLVGSQMSAVGRCLVDALAQELGLSGADAVLLAAVPVRTQVAS